MFRMRTLFAAIAAAAVIPATSQAATDQFLKIDGIPGESTSEMHPQEIEIQSWSWGMDRPSVATTQLAFSLGRPCVSELSMMKFVDKASPKLMGSLAAGTVLPKVKLSIVKASGGLSAPVDFFTIELAGAYVSSLQESGSSGGDQPMESISIKFSGATVTYTPISQLGKPGTPVPVILKTPPC